MGSFLGRFIILAVVGVVGVGIIVMLFGTQAEPERAKAAPRPVAVFVDQARLDSIALQVSSQGEARPRTQITLVPQVAGRITFVNPDFIEGGFFEAGETLVQIDDADYRLAVTRASAQVAQAQQALTREQAESELAASEKAIQQDARRARSKKKPKKGEEDADYALPDLVKIYATSSLKKASTSTKRER